MIIITFCIAEQANTSCFEWLLWTPYSSKNSSADKGVVGSISLSSLFHSCLHENKWQSKEHTNLQARKYMLTNSLKDKE